MPRPDAKAVNKLFLSDEELRKGTYLHSKLSPADLTWFKQLWVSSGVWTRNSIPSLNKDTLFFPESLGNLSASQEEGIPTSP